MLWLQVHGDEHPFNGAGHFPVLAGYDSSGREIYVARIRNDDHDVPYIFTCVSEGARNASIIGRDGRTRIARHFEVLVLRHDPCDVGVQEIPEGAKLQTGPVYWICVEGSDSDAASSVDSEMSLELELEYLQFEVDPDIVHFPSQPNPSLFDVDAETQTGKYTDSANTEEVPNCSTTE